MKYSLSGDKVRVMPSMEYEAGNTVKSEVIKIVKWNSAMTELPYSFKLNKEKNNFP